MNSFLRLLCLVALATAAFAQSVPSQFPSADSAQAVESSSADPEPSPAAEAPAVVPSGVADAVANEAAIEASSQPTLQLRSNAEPVVLPIATVLRLKLDRPISTASTRPGEQFTATLTRPVQVNGAEVIPAGAIVNCRVDRSHAARRFAGKSSLSIKAVSVRTASGQQLNFTASVVDTSNPQHLDVDQEGSVRGASPNPMNKVEMGSLTASGAIAGAVIAGPEGLLVGTAGGAMVAVGHMAVKRRQLTLPAGTELIFELDAAATVERPQNAAAALGGMQ
jgi:hypothetical protein